MKLYLTGADKFGGVQKNPLQSLGGLISSSPLANGSIGNLFGSVSQKQLKEGVRDVRCVALKNETLATQTVTLFYDNVVLDGISSFRMALLTPASDGCGGFYLEKVPTTKSFPVTGTFTDNRTIDNALTFSIDAGAYIGIWIERRITAGIGAKLLSCEELNAEFDAEDSSASMTVDIISDPHNSLFQFDTIENRYEIIFDDSSTTLTGSSDPSRERIIVKYLATDSFTQIGQKLVDKINQLLKPRGEVEASIIGSVSTISTISTGKVIPPTTPNASVFTIVSTQGSGGVSEELEELEITIQY